MHFENGDPLCAEDNIYSFYDEVQDPEIEKFVHEMFLQYRDDWAITAVPSYSSTWNWTGLEKDQQEYYAKCRYSWEEITESEYYIKLDELEYSNYPDGLTD
jgi:alpha-glucuronidase